MLCMYISVQFSRLLEPKIVSVQRFKRLSQNNVSIFQSSTNRVKSNSLFAWIFNKLDFLVNMHNGEHLKK